MDILLEGLNEREEYVIRMRFGLGTGKPKTLQWISRKLHITEEAIQQIETQAFQKLRTRHRPSVKEEYSEEDERAAKKLLKVIFGEG